MKYLKSFINKKPWEMEFSELVTFIEESGLRLTHSSDKKYYFSLGGFKNRQYYCHINITIKPDATADEIKAIDLLLETKNFKELDSYIIDYTIEAYSTDYQKKYYYPARHHAPENMYLTQMQEKKNKQPWEERWEKYALASKISNAITLDFLAREDFTNVSFMEFTKYLTDTGIRIEKSFYRYAPNALIFNLSGFADGKAVFYVFLKNDLKENDDLLSKFYEHALNGEFAFLDDYVQKFFIYDFEKNLIAASTSKKVG
mgnify:CR=1 FL=1|jgi:hypothetical protein